MNASAVGFELGSISATVSREEDYSAVVFSVADTGEASFLGPAGRTWLAILLTLLPGILCCGTAALLVSFVRWLYARAACRAPADVVAQPLARDSLASDADPRPEQHAGYGGYVLPDRTTGPGALLPRGLEMSSDCTVTNVGTDDMYRTIILPELAMVAGLHECTYTLHNSQRGLILLGVVRPGFNPRWDPETNAYDTPDAWLYGECTDTFQCSAPRTRSFSSQRRVRFADVKTGVKCHDGRSERWYGARGAETNDKVRMKLDLTSGSLEVFLNGESLGVMAEVSAVSIHPATDVHEGTFARLFLPVARHGSTNWIARARDSAELVRSALLDGAASNQR